MAVCIIKIGTGNGAGAKLCVVLHNSSAAAVENTVVDN